MQVQREPLPSQSEAYATRTLTSYHGLYRLPSAWVGGSVLDSPVDPALLARGFYVTYDPRSFKAAPRGVQDFGQHQTASAQGQVKPEDTKVVLDAMQRILRNQPEKKNPFGQFGQARPVR